MNRNNKIVAIYPSYAAAEAAVKKLQQSGFDLKKLSIVGRDCDTDEPIVGCHKVGDRMNVWGKTDTFGGRLCGLLFCAAFFWIPGFGPLLVAGPLVSRIDGALEGALVVDGLSEIGAGLCGLGIPKDSIFRYETALRAGKFVLIGHGVLADTTHAREILHRTKPEALEHHG